MREPNRNLIVRLLSAAVLSPILILLIIWDRPEPLILAVQAAVVVGLVELYWIVLREDPPWLRTAGVVLGLGVSLAMAWCPRPEAPGVALVAASVAACLLHLCHLGDIRTVAARVGLMIFGLVYVPMLLTPLGLLKRLPEGSDWIFLAATVTWFSDTGAYAVGRIAGRHRLYPRVSPGKSVEGALGGLAFSFGAAVLAKLWYMPQLGWADAVLVALPGGALGQAGDLVESMIKRAYEVKDSGWIIPGHGGLLDRIDALLFCTPYVYLYALYLFFGPAGRGLP